MKKIVAIALAVMLALSVVSALAEGDGGSIPEVHSSDDYTWLDDYSVDELKKLEGEVQKRLAQEDDSGEPGTSGDTSVSDPDDTDNASAGEVLLGLFLGANSATATNKEPIDLKVGEKIVTDTAEFEVVSLAMSPIERNRPSGWMTITGQNSKEKFLVDSDCCVLTIIYRVKNTSTKSKWYWPSNLLVNVKWDDYEFEKLDAKPFGDLQSTQTKEYIAVVELPNEIAQKGYENLTIEIGFKDSFEAISDMRYADHRFILPPLEYSRQDPVTEVPVMDGAAGGVGTKPDALTEYKDAKTVKAVQKALNEMGYNCGTPDGAAGKKTKVAVTKYQTDKGLTVTGTITYELLVSLGIQE